MEILVIGDIAQFFLDQDRAAEAFAMFDRDMNGDAMRDEMELACMELHRERLSLASSMRDIDSAVGRLDNILVSVYTIVILRGCPRHCRFCFALWCCRFCPGP